MFSSSLDFTEADRKFGPIIGLARARSGVPLFPFPVRPFLSVPALLDALVCLPEVCKPGIKWLGMGCPDQAFLWWFLCRLVVVPPTCLCLILERHLHCCFG